MPSRNKAWVLGQLEDPVDRFEFLAAEIVALMSWGKAIHAGNLYICEVLLHLYTATGVISKTLAISLHLEDKLEIFSRSEISDARRLYGQTYR